MAIQITNMAIDSHILAGPRALASGQGPTTHRHPLLASRNACSDVRRQEPT